MNACDTGRIPAGTEPDPFTGVTTALVLGGVRPRSRGHAAPRCGRRSHRLEKGRFMAGWRTATAIDAAVTERRHAIHALCTEAAEWAILIPFLRTPGGRILVPASEIAAAPGAAEPEVDR